MIARGMGVTQVRKGFVVAGFLLSLPMVLVAFVSDAHFAVGLFVVASFCFGFYSSNLWAITQTLAGPSAAGKWTGLAKWIRESGRCCCSGLHRIYRRGNRLISARFLECSCDACLRSDLFRFHDWTCPRDQLVNLAIYRRRPNKLP